MIFALIDSIYFYSFSDLQSIESEYPLKTRYPLVNAVSREVRWFILDVLDAFERKEVSQIKRERRKEEKEYGLIEGICSGRRGWGTNSTLRSKAVPISRPIEERSEETSYVSNYLSHSRSIWCICHHHQF